MLLSRAPRPLLVRRTLAHRGNDELGGDSTNGGDESGDDEPSPDDSCNGSDAEIEGDKHSGQVPTITNEVNAVPRCRCGYPWGICHSRPCVRAASHNWTDIRGRNDDSRCSIVARGEDCRSQRLKRPKFNHTVAFDEHVTVADFRSGGRKLAVPEGSP
jgi:hypothetical protein